MKNGKSRKTSRINIGWLIFLIGWLVSPFLSANDGVGLSFKLSLSKKIWKELTIKVEEDIRPSADFQDPAWFLTTGELNYQVFPMLQTGVGYMSQVKTRNRNEVKNRYYLYMKSTYEWNNFLVGVRERFQSTYKKHKHTPSNYLRSMFMFAYRIRSCFLPFVYVELYNNAGLDHGMHTDRIRYSGGCSYKIDGTNKIQLYYRYHHFNVVDLVNYKHVIGIKYSYYF